MEFRSLLIGDWDGKNMLNANGFHARVDSMKPVLFPDIEDMVCTN